MSKRLSQRSKANMSSRAEIPDLMWRAFPARRQDNRKSWLAGVARALGWNQRRTKALFYCEARVVTADEWRTLNERLDAAKNREKQANELRSRLGGLGEGLPVAAREVSPPLPFAPSETSARKEREA